jgi:diguanylate cyclase (GGDEF)-like protein
LKPNQEERRRQADSPKPILILDDDPADRLRVKHSLKAHSSEFPFFLEANSIDQALAILETNDPICCLLDFELGGEFGVEFLDKLKDLEKSYSLPVVALTGHNHSEVAARLLKAGAHDYLVKDELSRYTLYRAIHHAIDTCALQTKLLQLAHRDPLTGLFNRSLFMQKLDQTVLATAQNNYPCAIMYLDVDHFKQINDTYGHEFGDEVLKDYARRILECTRDTDCAARLGGDEFVILLPQISILDAALVGERLLASLSKPIDVQGIRVECPASIGIAHCPTTAKDAADLLSQADQALYQVKRTGRSQCLLFSGELMDQVKQQESLRKQLPKAIESGNLELTFQSSYSTTDRAPGGVEFSGHYEMINVPSQGQKFEDSVRDLRLENQYHSWLFEQSFQQLAASDTLNNLRVSFHVVFSQRVARNTVELLKAVANRQGVEASNIEVILKEADLAKNIDNGHSFVTMLSQQGFKVAIDQFGCSGLALNKIAEMPISSIIVDIESLPAPIQTSQMKSYLTGITRFGKSIGVEVHVRGIRQSSELDVVLRSGCDTVQGPYLRQSEFENDRPLDRMKELLVG